MFLKIFKESHYSSLASYKWSFFSDSCSNGGVLATPLSLKAAAGLPHPLTTPAPHCSLPHDSSLWIENRPDCWRNSENSDKDTRSLSESRLLHNGSIVTAALNDYAETGTQKQAGSRSGINTPGSDAMPAYAEVDPNHTAPLTTFQGHRGCDERCGGPASSDGSSSPAPYATTTLVGSSHQHLNGLVGAHNNYYLLHTGYNFYFRFPVKIYKLNFRYVRRRCLSLWTWFYIMSQSSVTWFHIHKASLRN